MANTVPIDIVTITEPYSYKHWLARVTSAYVSEHQSYSDYNEYITEWYALKNKTVSSHKTDVKEMYTSLLKDIALNYTTVEEKRFLLNIDYSNPRDLDIVIPFYAKKIKQISHYHIKKREEVIQSSFRNTVKGSDFGVRLSIKNYILSLLSDTAFTSQFNTSVPDISKIGERIVVETKELYESDQVEYDLDPKSLTTAGDNLSAYSANIEDIEPLLFLDIGKLITRELSKVDLTLSTSDCMDPQEKRITQSNHRLAVTFPQTWEQLPLSSFIGGEKTYDNLVYNYQKQLITKFTGSTYYYLSSDSTGTASSSGILFKPDASHRNILNRYYPGHLTVPIDVSYKTMKQLGGFYVPPKLGLLTFASYNPNYTIQTTGLSSNTIYSYPDPALYGQGRGLSRSDQLSPVTHVENVDWAKHNLANGYIAGDIINDSNLPRFNAYQSREESTEYQPSGVSKITDSIDFWTGTTKNIWKNPDLYPNYPLHELPIQNRLDDLIIGDQTVHEWKTDIFGNEFALYKKAHKTRSTTFQDSGNLVKPSNTRGLENDLDTDTEVVDVSGTWFSTPKTTFHTSSFYDLTNQQVIFTTWPRWASTTTGSDRWHPHPTKIPFTSQAYHLAIDANNSVFLNENISFGIGAVTPTAVPNYVIDTVVTSADSDNDSIGLTLAIENYKNGIVFPDSVSQIGIPTNNTTATAKPTFAALTISMQRGGMYQSHPLILELFYPDETGEIHRKIIGSVNPDKMPWTPTYSWNQATARIRAEKVESKITVWSSTFGSSHETEIGDHTLTDDSKIIIDLENRTITYHDSKRSQFGVPLPWVRDWGFNWQKPDSTFPQQFGIYARSQKYSKWVDLIVATPDSTSLTKFNTLASPITADSTLTSRYNTLTGTVYVRNVHSTMVDPISSALSGVFTKYATDPTIMNEINNNIIDFDIIQDVIFLQTSNYIIIEKYDYSYTTDIFTTVLSRKVNLSRFKTSVQQINEVTY